MEEAGRGCVRVPLWGSKAGQVRVGDTAGLPWGARREAGNGQGRQEPALYPGPAHTQAPASCLRPGRLPAARGRACRGPARSLRPRRSLCVCVWGGVGPARSRGLPGSRTAPGGALRERGHRGGREEELGGGPGPARPGGADYRRQCAAPPVAMVTPLPAGGPQPGPGGRPPSPSSLPPFPPRRRGRCHRRAAGRPRPAPGPAASPRPPHAELGRPSPLRGKAKGPAPGQRRGPPAED